MDVWPYRSVGVTGGNGALGRRLVRQLLVRGVRRLVVFDQKPASSEELASRSGVIENVAGDILSLPDLEQALAGCSLVFHLAALTHAGRSRVEPSRYWDVNALGTARVVEACRRLGVPHLIYTSTAHVYGLPQRLPVDESHPTSPLSVYAASKLAGETALQGYAADFNMGTTIARLSNLYGGGLGALTVIGRAVKQAAEGGPIQLRNLSSVRDFVHLDDAVEGLLRLGALEAEPGRCQIVNVAGGAGISTGDMANKLAAVAERQGRGVILIAPLGEAVEERVPILILTNERLRELTGWAPSIELEEGLALALQEYQLRTN